MCIMMVSKKLYFVVLSVLFSFTLVGCQFTEQQQAAFNPEKAAFARLKLGLGYLAQAEESPENIKKAHYNLNLANQYSPNNPNIMLGMALFDQHVGQYDEADMIYRNIVKMEPMNGLYSNHYGSFLCARERYNEAKIQFKHAISLDKPKWKIDGLEQLGYCALQNNDIKEADQTFKQLFRYDTTAQDRVAKMADEYRQKGAVKIADYLNHLLNNSK